MSLAVSVVKRTQSAAVFMSCSSAAAAAAFVLVVVDTARLYAAGGAVALGLSERRAQIIL